MIDKVGTKIMVNSANRSRGSITPSPEEPGGLGYPRQRPMRIRE